MPGASIPSPACVPADATDNSLAGPSSLRASWLMLLPPLASSLRVCVYVDTIRGCLRLCIAAKIPLLGLFGVIVVDGATAGPNHSPSKTAIQDNTMSPIRLGSANF